MLIPYEHVHSFLLQRGTVIKGILHIGAHECEEKIDYNKLGLDDGKIFWVDGNADKVNQMKSQGIKNIYCALIDETENDVDFFITNNGQSSSILALETHAVVYPFIVVTETRRMKTTTVEQLLRDQQVDGTQLNFWNLDIQGAELKALKGATSLLPTVDAIYTEVNVEHLYKDCVLLPELDAFLQGFGFNRVLTQMCGDAGWGDALYIRA